MSKATKLYLRFPVAQRIEHLTMLLSFGILGLTGLPQKYATAGISVFIINLLGGIETVRTIHHTAAIVMMLGTIYHLLMMGYKLFVRRVRMTMLPTLQDLKDGFQALKYNVGLSKQYPQMGRYTFEEKMEYWAFVWGTVIMGLSGFMMWNPITTAKYFPGEFIPAAKAAHGGEALLAVLAIIIWHMYGVHIRRFNKAMWTGKITEAEMLHEHPLELADIKAGVAEPVIDPKTLRKRKLLYIPIATILAAVMLFGVYGFVLSEKTAVTTLPPFPSPVPIYVPQTPTPMPEPSPTNEAGEVVLTWNGSVGPIFQTRCGACHGVLGGLSFGSYASAMTGSQNGAVILPGDPVNSRVIIVQEAGGHPGQLLPEELQIIRQWIEAGAPEK